MRTTEIIGEITDVTAREILAELALAGDSPVVVRVNSQGGSVQAGVTIYEALKAHRPGVTVEIVGWALSAASLIAMAGRPVRMAPTSLLMVHAPWTSATGNASELRDTAAALDAVARSMRAAFSRTKQPPKTIDAWLTGEHWFTAEEAIAAGLADELIPEMQACAPMGVMACAFSIPDHIKGKLMATPTPDATAAARLADLERREAIRTDFAPFLKHPGGQQFMNQLLDDKTCTAENAGPRILSWLGSTGEPIGAYRAEFTGEDFVDTSAGQLRDFASAASDALLIRAGMRVPNPHPSARDLSRMSVVDMAERVLSMSGISTRGMSRSEILSAGLTRGDFPELLLGVGNRALRDGYETAPNSHAVWTAEREVVDFRPQNLLQLSEAPDLRRVNEGGEFTYSYFSEAVESFSIETFGRIIALTRQALINDDLGAFTRIPEAFGKAARRLEADHVYAKLTGTGNLSDGLPLFHADHNNLGAAAALSVESLGVARSAMRRHKTMNGLGYLDLMPAFLIVPTSLETEAESLLFSLSRPDATHSGVGNPSWVRSLELVSDPRLDAVSETAWYLAAHPASADGIIRAYLAGAARPDIITEQEFRVDQSSWKTRLDFGVAIIDYRSLYKNPGA